MSRYLEANYKQDVFGALVYHGWDVEIHEDKFQNFIPDMSFANKGIDGWIELKWQDSPPATLGSIDHWTRGQEDWLTRRGRSGSGHCFLMVGTPNMHALWRYGTLSSVREIKWQSALAQAWKKDYDLPRLLEQFNEAVRRR